MNQKEVNEQLEHTLDLAEAEAADMPLVVEIPNAIRAGVRAVAAAPARSCSPYSSCYKLNAL